MEVDITSTFSSIGTLGTNYSFLQLITRGTQFYQRIGASIHVKFIRLSYTIVGGQSNLSTDDEYNTVAIRMFLAPGTITLLVPPVCSMITATSTKSVHTYLSHEIKLQSFARNSTGYMPAVKHEEFTIPINRTFVWSQDEDDAYPMFRLVLQMISDSLVVSNPGVTTGKLATFYTDS